MTSLNGGKEAAQAFRLDLVEKILVVTLLGVLAVRQLPEAVEKRDVLPLLLVGMEAMVVAFVLFRRKTQDITKSWRDWAFGIAGTTAPLLAGPHSGSPLIPLGFCTLLMLIGLGFNISAKLTLRRSFGVVAANRGVKIGGPYRLVRHPMYAGYILTHIGFLLSGPTLWNTLIYIFAATLQIARIFAEEQVLGQDEAYIAMSKRVRYRLIPFVF